MRKKASSAQSEPPLTRSRISNPTQNTELSVRRNLAPDAEKVRVFKQNWELGKNGFFVQKNTQKK
jgi:hypothetical protein